MDKGSFGKKRCKTSRAFISSTNDTFNNDTF